MASGRVEFAMATPDMPTWQGSAREALENLPGATA
jgi:hypothetical protein